MKIIPIEIYPIKYHSFESAIEGAKNNPLQPKAKADSDKFAGTTIVDAYWTDTDFVIRFSNERLLHIWVCPEKVEWMGDVQWEVVEVPPPIDEDRIQRVGSEPVILRWHKIGDYAQDCSALAAKRRGAEFQRLSVNEFGLLVYCRKQMIWYFGAARRTDIDKPILGVVEDD